MEDDDIKKKIKRSSFIKKIKEKAIVTKTSTKTF